MLKDQESICEIRLWVEQPAEEKCFYAKALLLVVGEVLVGEPLWARELSLVVDRPVVHECHSAHEQLLRVLKMGVEAHPLAQRILLVAEQDFACERLLVEDWPRANPLVSEYLTREHCLLMVGKTALPNQLLYADCLVE